MLKPLSPPGCVSSFKRKKPPEPAGLRTSLPKSKDNIVERLIRDPPAPHRPARQRLCTEMLCGVLGDERQLAGFVGGPLAARLRVVDEAQAARRR